VLVDEGAGQGEAAGEAGELGGDDPGAGLLVWPGRHMIIVAGGQGWSRPRVLSA
jgi:hypothetical protein